MNKKTLITIIVVPLVLFLIAGVIGAQYIFKPKDISVTGVSFVGDDITESQDNSKTLVIDLDESNTYQLQWNILPSDATNKNVTFKYDGNNKISVDNNGKITVNATNETVAPFYAGKVTIITNDGQKTDTVLVQTSTDKPQEMSYDFATNTITANEQILYDEDLNKYTIFAGRNYQLLDSDATYTISLSESDAVELMDSSNEQYKPNSISALKSGTFTLTVTSEGQEVKTLNFKVVEGVTYLGLPTALDIVEKPENYYIGNQNNYYFDYKIVGSTSFTQIQIYQNGETLLEGTALNSVANIINDREIKFTENALNNKYTIKVSSQFDSSISVSYTFTVIDAWNVRNHTELSAAFNDGATQKDSIVLTDNITITDADLPANFKNHNSYSTTSGGWKGIYTRYADLVFEGNNHEISASSVSYFAKVGSGDTDDFGHERPSLFHIAKYDAIGRNLTMYKDFYYTPEFAQMVTEIGSDPTYTNTSDPTRLPIREAQAEYVKSLYEDENTTIPKVYINNLKMEGNGGKNVVDSSTTYMGFRSLCGIKNNGAKLYLTGCDIQRFLDGVKGDSAISITLDNCYVGDMSGFDIYTTRTRYVTIKDSTLGEAGHVTTLMTPSGSDTYVDRFTKYDGVYAYEQNPNNYYDSQTGLPLAALDPRVTNTTDGAVDTNGQVLKLVGDVIFDNWFDLKGPFLQTDVTSYQSAQIIKSFLTTMLGANSAILFKNYSADNKDDALLNYAIQLESAGKPTNYTYLDRSELNSSTKYTDTYDATTFHKLILSAQSIPGLPATVTSANINNSRLNSEIMCVGANFKTLQSMGESYLSTIIVGINKDSGFHLA